MATPVKNEIENDSDAETFIEETLWINLLREIYFSKKLVKKN